MALTTSPFQREILTLGFFEEVWPLFQLHYEEIAQHQDIAMDPDIEAYLTAEKLGMARLYTIRDEERLLRGYAIFFVKPNLHYKQSKQAYQDLIYLHPKQRGEGLGLKLVEWCDEQLKSESVQVVYHHVKAAHNWGHALERMGYTLVDHIYGRRLN